MKRLLLIASVTLLLGPSLSGQLTDLQSGRNFPTALSAFGGNRSENIDVGDIDNDGDLDVIVANGGDFGNEPNRIYINNGGLQGGTVGTFSEQTTTRFAGAPNDTSRDIEFADIDNDGDLDVYVSNRGGNTTGQTSRFYVNQGGAQGGTIGFFSEDTANRWGALVSVPLTDQIAGGNAGPWRDWSCDCDFGDLDDDGDLDLFHSSYGPSINGTRDSRVFLNDGTGMFDELWPWTDEFGGGSPDTQWHTLDIDLVDLDGDLDIDLVVSSRNSQARVFVNNTYNRLGGTTRLFSDVTQEALLDQGATLSGSSNYEGEFGDLDGDGDFDVWMKNYSGFGDRLLMNGGTDANGIVRFTMTAAPIKGDPNVDENELDLLDFDGDGDLDAFAANFSGTNWIYAGGLAQGLGAQFHRTGTTSGGSQYSSPETPSASNAGTTLDGEVGDMDNDGDHDLLLANDGGQSNRYWRNALGVPDSHAPTIPILDNMPGGAGTVVHAQLRDNAPYYLIAYYDVVLVYSIDGAPEVNVDMFSQGSQQFRAEIPASADGATCIEYHVNATDDAGNTTISATHQIGTCGPSAWTDLGFALAGVNGEPVLVGAGPLTGGSSNSFGLSNAAPNAVTAMFVSLAAAPTPFKGGTLVTVPILLTLNLATGPTGEIALPFTFPTGIPAGFDFFVQVGIADGAAVNNVALSNALQGEAQ